MEPVAGPDKLHGCFAESHLSEGCGCQRGVQSDGLGDGLRQVQLFEHLAVTFTIYAEKRKKERRKFRMMFSLTVPSYMKVKR